ncbi:winged helix family two component transcriptional regulator [Panacagrimonas perspica]|uniref:Winged helix family two component transcriptional regulator n=1 Tax=Panacagrimonas perspica TaxID=381431 RepID=A0A4S3JZU0_9GAMM|nr:response regulator [Panacagrimonas perspica]TDU32196.1 winged helix family two component transcriptional regulator [Panacagrimonas perspica]THD01106.1 DNA-binding response regulator [Panacagrimonas perspica]
MRILLVEDDAMLGEAVRKGLALQSHAVDWARDGEAAAEHWRSANYDLVLLDLGLPRRDGLSVLRDARRDGLETPVLILTARDAVNDRVGGLDAGADDYLLKPFDLDELLARVRALGRRHAGRVQSKVEHLDLVIDLADRTAQFKGEAVALTRREFALLGALIEQPGRVWTREQLVERLYGWNEEIASNALDVHVHALRRKLSADFIRNARGVGYYIPKDA